LLGFLGGNNCSRCGTITNYFTHGLEILSLAVQITPKYKLKIMTQLIKEFHDNRWSASKWLITIEMMFCPFDYSKQNFKHEPLIDFLKLLDNNRSEFISRFTDVITDSPKRGKNLLLQLISTSDRIFLNLKKISHANVNIPNNAIVRKAYMRMMNIIESLLELCGKINKNIYYDLPLTKFDCIIKRTKLRGKISHIRQKLRTSSCNPQLIALIVRKLHEIVNADALEVGKFRYANMLVKKINLLSEVRDEDIVALLIKNNFNSPEFFDFCIEEYNKIIANDCLYTQIELIVSIEESLNNTKTICRWRLNKDDNSIRDQLIHYFTMRKHYLEKRLDLRRAQIADEKLQEDSARIETALTVAEMGFLIKLFLEHNIIPTKNIKKIYVFFAQNFSSKGAKFISPDSMQKKASNVEFATAKKIKGVLLTMVAWINKHHHVENYAG